jgi:hypothetical protein
MIATEVVEMDKTVVGFGFDPATFDPEAFAEGLMAEDRAVREARTEADERRREESPEAERLRREILDVRTPMAWHDDRRHAYKLWLRQTREVFYREYEEAARRGQWSEAEQNAVTTASNEVRKVFRALADLDALRQEERFTNRDDERPAKDNHVLRGRLVRMAAEKSPVKRGELLRKEKIEAAQQRKIERGLILLRCRGMQGITEAFLDEEITLEMFQELRDQIKKGIKKIDVERHGYGAARRDIRKKPKRNNKQKKRGKGKATTSARGGRK